MNISNLKIGVRLAIGFAVTLALLVTIAVTGITRISGLSDDVQLMTSDRFPKTVQANEMVRAINVIARNIRNAALFSGAEQQKALEAIGPQRKIISDNLEKLDKSVKSEKGREILKKIGDARTAYVAQQDKAMEFIKADKKSDLVALMQGGLRTT
ncbi:MAG: MCP four helix bundle domain-containing protein, partial [Proteobacteria bacterium]|nr:MCP four helix bundle domain-containing protein [Pseudomonadota bacterium]